MQCVKGKVVKCAIMQPTYMPWLGYFDLMDKVDIFVYLDNVQLVKRSWQVRNRIKTSQGELFLTIPIKKTDSRKRILIKDAVINDDENWRYKHIRSIELAYKKSPYFDEVFPVIKRLICNDIVFLGDFNVNLIEEIRRRIGISSFTVRSSLLGNMFGKKDELLANICDAVKADVYISPIGSAVYIEKNESGGALVKRGIDLYYHNYEHPVYEQINGAFRPYMGIVDLLFNVGFEQALSVIRSGRKRDIHYSNIKHYLDEEILH